MTGTEEALNRAAEVLRSARSIVTTGHVNPDGDALGAALGTALAARKAGRRAWVVFSEPVRIADTYGFLPLEAIVPMTEVPSRIDALIAYDTATRSRIGDVGDLVDRADVTVVVDHHRSEEGFGDVDVIDSEAAASAQLALSLIRRLEWPVDEEVATCLLTGIVTDTGRFQYSNASPSALRAAADLVEAGARPEVIGQSVFENVPFGYLRVESSVLGRAVLDGDLVWSALYLDDLASAGIGIEDTDPLIDSVRIAREAGVAALLKERTGGGWKVSLRSRGRVDVGSIASTLGGGGHHNAAGFDASGTVEDVIGAVRELLPGE